MKLFARHRAESFDEIVARCLSLVESGEATIDVCVERYPADGERLRAALRTAMAVRDALAASPGEAFAARLRGRVLAEAGRQPATVPTRAPAAGSRRRFERPALLAWSVWRPVATGAAGLALVLTVAFPIAAKTSADALPGDWNYGVKRTTEQVLLTLDLADHLDLADERARELQRLAASGNLSHIVSTTRAYESELHAARAEIARGGAPPEQIRRAEEHVEEQRSALQATVDRVQQAAQGGGQTAPGATPPPDVVRAQQAAQSALNTATEARQEVAVVASTAEAQAAARAAAGSATATPASPATRRTPTAGGTPAASPSAPAATSTAITAAATPEPAASASPSPGPSPSATPGRPLPSPSEIPEATETASPTVAPAATAGRSPVAAPTPATSTPVPEAPAAIRSPVPTTVPAPTAVAPAPAPTAPPSPSPIPATPRPPTATATPAPTPGPAAAPTRPPAAVPAATPEPAPTPVRVPQLTLEPGPNMLVYRGPNAPVAAVFAGLEGKYAWIEWRLPDSEISIRYVPGRDTVPFMIVTGSALTIMMTDEVTVPYGTLWSAGGPR